MVIADRVQAKEKEEEKTKPCSFRRGGVGMSHACVYFVLVAIMIDYVGVCVPV